MPPELTYDETWLFHHFTRHLGRWLDCTNAPRLFTLLVTEWAIESPVLGNAVICFSARHQRKTSVAEEAYERCISLLIDRLGMTSDSYDECLLCAVLLLHFADQLKCTSPFLTTPLDFRLPGTYIRPVRERESSNKGAPVAPVMAQYHADIT
jgi:hypothetical protein